MMSKGLMKTGTVQQIDQGSKLSQINWNMAMNPMLTEIKIMDIQIREDLDKIIELKKEVLDMQTNQIEVILFHLMQEDKINLSGSIEILDQLNHLV